MTSVEFNPRKRVADIGFRAVTAVEYIADGKPWSPAVLYAAADYLKPMRPRIAKRLHDLGAVWAVNFKGVSA